MSGSIRASVAFSDKVRGQFLQRSGAVALSLIQKPPADVLNPDISNGLSGDLATVTTGGQSLPKLQRFQCFDTTGHLLPDVRVSVK